MTSNDNARLPRNKHFVLIFADVNVISFLAYDVRNGEKQIGVNGCVQCSQSDFFMIFSGVFDESFHGIV